MKGWMSCISCPHYLKLFYAIHDTQYKWERAKNTKWNHRKYLCRRRCCTFVKWKFRRQKKRRWRFPVEKEKYIFYTKKLILCKEIEKLNLVKNARCLDSGHIKTHWHFLLGICMRSQQKINIKYFETLWDVWWIMPLLILFVVSITFKF